MCWPASVCVRHWAAAVALLTVGAGATRIVTCETKTKSFKASEVLSRKAPSFFWLTYSVSEKPWKNRSSASCFMHRVITSVSQAASTFFRDSAPALHVRRELWILVGSQRIAIRRTKASVARTNGTGTTISTFVSLPIQASCLGTTSPEIPARVLLHRPPQVPFATPQSQRSAWRPSSRTLRAARSTVCTCVGCHHRPRNQTSTSVKAMCMLPVPQVYVHSEFFALAVLGRYSSYIGPVDHQRLEPKPWPMFVGDAVKVHRWSR